MSKVQPSIAFDWARRLLALSCLCAVFMCSSAANAQSALERLEKELERLTNRGGSSDANQEEQDEEVPQERQGSGAGQSGELPPPRGNALERLELSIDPDLLPYFGVFAVDLTPRIAAELDVPVASGAVIDVVVPNSPAAVAEIPEGAVIVAVEGRRVDRRADLEQQVARHRPGDEILVLFYVGTRLRRADVLLGGISAEDAQEFLEPDAITEEPLPFQPRNANPELRLNETQQVEPLRIEPQRQEPERQEPQRRGGPLRILDRIPRIDRNERNDSEIGELTNEVRRLIQVIEAQQSQIQQLERRISDLERKETTSDEAGDGR